MISTNIVRKLDDLGRIVIPIELRRKFDIKELDDIEIFVKGETIILRKHRDKCVLCGNEGNLTTFKNKAICDKCKIC